MHPSAYNPSVASHGLGSRLISSISIDSLVSTCGDFSILPFSASLDHLALSFQT